MNLVRQSSYLSRQAKQYCIVLRRNVHYDFYILSKWPAMWLRCWLNYCPGSDFAPA